MTRLLLLTGAVILMLAEPAAAHGGEGVAGGFKAGFLHPITGLDHLLAMAAVGVWGVFLRRPLIWALPVAFPLMMVVGGVLGILGLPLPLIEPGIALSVIILGLAIAAAWKAAIPVAVGIVAFFALFHGYAHGAELPHAANPAAYTIGFVLATGSIHLGGIGFGLIGGLPRGDLILRAVGAMVAATGVVILVH